jgi:hypothetical protein
VKIGRRRDGSTTLEANDKTKSGMTAGIWRSNEERKLGWWAKCAVGPNY